MMKGKLVCLSGIHGVSDLIQAAIIQLDSNLCVRDASVKVARSVNAGRIYVTGAEKAIEAWHFGISKRADVMFECAGRALLYDSEIFPAMEEGKIILCQYGMLDSMAHICMHFATQDCDKLLEMEEFSRKFYVPDLTILVDIDPAKSAQWAVNEGADPKFYNVEYYTRLREIYFKLAKEKLSANKLRIIRANGDIEAFIKEVEGIIIL